MFGELNSEKHGCLYSILSQEKKKNLFSFDSNVVMALDVKSVSALKLMKLINQFNANSLIKGTALTDINIITRRAMPQTKKTFIQHNSQIGSNKW